MRLICQETIHLSNTNGRLSLKLETIFDCSFFFLVLVIYLYSLHLCYSAGTNVLKRSFEIQVYYYYRLKNTQCDPFWFNLRHIRFVFSILLLNLKTSQTKFALKKYPKIRNSKSSYKCSSQVVYQCTSRQVIPHQKEKRMIIQSYIILFFKRFVPILSCALPY